MKNNLYIITGQTGTGKTQLALNLAGKIGGDLISADARQAYKHLDVITGKDMGSGQFRSVEELGDYSIGYYDIQGIKVWLYDIVDPKCYFSAFDWAQCAKRTLELISESGRTPILAGGTYFYLETLLFGLTEGTEPQWSMRKELEKKSVYELRKEAKDIHPEDFTAMNSSDQYNPRRLIRFIEKHRSGSGSMRNFQGVVSDYSAKYAGLVFSSPETAREVLTTRVDKRLSSGAVAEVETLLAMRYSRIDPGLNTIGYKQILSHLAGTATLAQAREEWITKEYQYARRQYTLMKRNELIVWYTCDGKVLPNVNDLL